MNINTLKGTDLTCTYHLTAAGSLRRWWCHWNL